MKKNQKIRIITLSVRIRRKLVDIRTRVRAWLDKQRLQREQDRLIRLIRKRYIQSGKRTIMIKYYELPYEAEWHINNLQRAGLLTYEWQERNYIIHIKEGEDDI